LREGRWEGGERSEEEERGKEGGEGGRTGVAESAFSNNGL